MSITSDPNLWAICILVFLLGLLVGVFLTAGGRRKWKSAGGYPTLTHGGLSVLEVAVPWIELTK